MGILVRDSDIDRKVRELAQRTGTTLQGAIGNAVDRDLRRLDERKQRIERAFQIAREDLKNFPVVDDGLTHKEFWDREDEDA